jgi:hypothetical protein
VKPRKPGGFSLATFAKDAVTANLGLKAICFLCALMLLAYQRSQVDETARTIAFAVNAKLPPDNALRELMSPLPPSINVTVQGSSSTLDSLTESTPKLDLDLRDGRRQNIDFSADQLDIPTGLSVRLIDPPSLRLDWQDIITREIRVQSSVTGRVADGYEVARLTVEPETVELRGPASLVRVTQLARVAPFDITGLSEGSHQRQLALDPAPSRTQYIELSSVTVSAEIRRRQIAVNFPRLSVEIVGIPGAKVVPARVDVTVRGTPEVVKALQPELVIPLVDASNVDTSKHGSVALPVTVALTRATAEIQPPSVKLNW